MSYSVAQILERMIEPVRHKSTRPVTAKYEEAAKREAALWNKLETVTNQKGN